MRLLGVNTGSIEEPVLSSCGTSHSLPGLIVEGTHLEAVVAGGGLLVETGRREVERAEPALGIQRQLRVSLETYTLGELGVEHVPVLASRVAHPWSRPPRARP